jgi:hypothetical protein
MNFSSAVVTSAMVGMLCGGKVKSWEPKARGLALVTGGAVCVRDTVLVNLIVHRGDARLPGIGAIHIGATRIAVLRVVVVGPRHRIGTFDLVRIGDGGRAVELERLSRLWFSPTTTITCWMGVVGV